MSGSERIVEGSLSFWPTEWTAKCDAQWTAKCEREFHPTYESQIKTYGGILMVCDTCREYRQWFSEREYENE